MASNCIDAKISDGNLHEGLRILARIIARDFMAKNAMNGDVNRIGEHELNERNEKNANRSN